MKVYQVYHGSTVLYTFSTREKAMDIKDWCCANVEDYVRKYAYPSFNRTHENRISRDCEDYFVMEVEVLD